MYSKLTYQLLYNNFLGASVSNVEANAIIAELHEYNTESKVTLAISASSLGLVKIMDENKEDLHSDQIKSVSHIKLQICKSYQLTNISTAKLFNKFPQHFYRYFTVRRVPHTRAVLLSRVVNEGVVCTTAMLLNVKIKTS